MAHVTCQATSSSTATEGVSGWGQTHLSWQHLATAKCLNFLPQDLLKASPSLGLSALRTPQGQLPTSGKDKCPTPNPWLWLVGDSCGIGSSCIQWHLTTLVFPVLPPLPNTLFVPTLSLLLPEVIVQSNSTLPSAYLRVCFQKNPAKTEIWCLSEWDERQCIWFCYQMKRKALNALVSDDNTKKYYVP